VCFVRQNDLYYYYSSEKKKKKDKKNILLFFIFLHPKSERIKNYFPHREKKFIYPNLFKITIPQKK